MRVGDEMIYTMGNVINDELLRVAYLLSDPFPISSPPTLTFWNVLKMLPGQVWPMEGTSGTLEDKMPAYSHPPSFSWVRLCLIIAFAGLALHHCSS